MGLRVSLVISLKVIYFQSIFMIDFLYKKTDLYAGIWNNFTQSSVQQEIEKKAENVVKGAECGYAILI